MDEARVVEAARAASIGLYGIADFYAKKPGEQGMLFGYGGTDAGTIERGMARLAALMPSISY
jgi:GntR family transcriptional regulator / MocR family aminotransferase